MDELIERLVANVGVDRGVAEQSVAIILEFLLREGPADKVRILLDRVPGGDAIVAQSGTGSMGGIMGVGTRLMSAGLGMGEMQAVTREVIAYAREKAGEDTVGEIVDAIPGLSQFV